MSNEFELIHFHVFDPSRPTLFKQSKNEKAEAFFVYCENKDNCGLYKRGECIRRNSFKWKCVYGRNEQHEGFSRRSNNFRKWISDIKEKYKDTGTLKQTTEKMVEIGDYIYLPYSRVNWDESIPFVECGGVWRDGLPFILKNNFTVENIEKMIKYRPYAMMGGEITDYQQKTIPIFLQHLSELFPEIFKELTEKSEVARNKIAQYSPVGRTAFLKTTNPNFYVKDKGRSDAWFWDGEKLTCNYLNGLFNPVKDFESTLVTVIPNDKTKIVITDAQQVNSNTIFFD